MWSNIEVKVTDQDVVVAYADKRLDEMVVVMHNPRTREVEAGLPGGDVIKLGLLSGKGSQLIRKFETALVVRSTNEQINVREVKLRHTEV